MQRNCINFFNYFILTSFNRWAAATRRAIRTRFFVAFHAKKKLKQLLLSLPQITALVDGEWFLVVIGQIL